VAVVAPRLIIVVGPTASGKSALALELAERHQGEIVSCDSLQVYRGLDIGSAKATPAERARVPHHLLDVIDPDGSFSAADYARLAAEALSGIAARGRLAVVVGGTGLYLRALVGGLFEGPGRDEALRRRLEGLARRFGDGRLHRLLGRVDPLAASRIAPRDRLRVVRALEVFRATGRPLSEHHAERVSGLSGFAVLTLGLARERDALRLRVEARTDAMLAHGLLDETERLLSRGYSPALRPLRAIGYRQAVAIVLREMGLEEGRRDIVAATMRYAKRQMTWFRHQAAPQWCASEEEAVQRAAAWLAEAKE
jgi:tRNA dimethylallyltransferase